jgi:hypothetical protein
MNVLVMGIREEIKEFSGELRLFFLLLRIG